MHTCACCGYKTLLEPDAWLVCPICFWGDDPAQAADPTLFGPIQLSLRRAQHNFVLSGVSDLRFRDRVRPPAIFDERDRNWSPWRCSAARNDDAVLKLVDASFANVPRPEHFTNWNHCDECSEHDATLRSQERGSFEIQVVLNPCWNPLAFMTPEGFQYFFPELVRMALNDSKHGFLHDFLRNRICTYNDNRQVSLFTPAQIRSTLQFFEYAMNTSWMDLECDWPVLMTGLREWRQRVSDLKCGT